MRPEENEEGVPEDPVEEEEDTSELEELEERLEEWEHRSKSPKAMKRKSTITMALGVVWIGFAIVWLFFLAPGYTLFESIAVVLAALFLLLGLTSLVMWGPPEWRVRYSGALGILWLTFIILWMPFYRNYGILIYQGYAIVILSFIIISLIIGGFWLPIVPKSNWQPSKGRVAAAAVLFYTWLIILMFWFWFYADTYSIYRNWAIALLVTLASFLIIGGIVSSEIPTGPSHQWTGTAIGLAWFAIMILWLWFFADNFLPTQNLAIFLLVSAIFVILGSYRGRSWMGELESFDWKD